MPMKIRVVRRLPRTGVSSAPSAAPPFRIVEQEACREQAPRASLALVKLDARGAIVTGNRWFRRANSRDRDQVGVIDLPGLAASCRTTLTRGIRRQSSETTPAP